VGCESNAFSSHTLLSSGHKCCSGVDVYTALAGATGALYGPLHGGANEVDLEFTYISRLES
jgi:citrate synthase